MIYEIGDEIHLVGAMSPEAFYVRGDNDIPRLAGTRLGKIIYESKSY